MLSANFYSTYQQYKRDTNAVASWLASTAKQHGYDGQIGTPLSRGSRPEGKARKLANQRQRQRQQQQGLGSTMDSNSKNASDQQPQQTGPAYVLAVRDFVPLGQFIAKKLDNLAKVPSHFTASLTRVIRARRGFMSIYAKANSDDEDAKTNRTHAYFVTVLETVYHILVPAESRVNLKADVDMAVLTSGMSALKSSQHTLANPFGVLPIYEPSEAFLNAPDVPASSSTDDDTDKQHLLYTVEEDNSEYECKFAFVMLLQDLISLRQEVAALWQAYDDGGISLAAAATSANLAVELARAMEEEISPLLERHGGALTVLSEFFAAACVAAGHDPTAKARPKDDMNFACYDLGHALFHHVASIMYSVAGVVSFDAKSFPRYSGAFGYYDPQQSSTIVQDGLVGFRQQWAQEKAALLELVPNLCLLTDTFQSFPIMDEFTRGLSLLIKTKKVPLWLCFAGQNYLDTLRILGPKVDKGYRELKTFSQETVALVQHAVAKAPSTASKRDLEEIERIATITSGGSDMFALIWNAARRRGEAMRPCNFFQHHPLFCGLMIHYVRSRLHQVGVAYAARPGAALHSVQLYAAVQQHQQQRGKQASSEEEALEWTLLDQLLDRQGPQAFFVGSETPSSPEAHFKNYCMSRQISPANWLAAANRRKGKKGKVPVKMSGAGVRELKFAGQFSLLCAHRMAKQGANSGLVRAPWDVEYVQQALEAQGHLLAKARVDSKNKNVKSGTTSPYHPSALVRRAADAVDQEVSDMTFDYFSVHQAASEFLQQIHDHVTSHLLRPEMRSLTPVDTVGFVFSLAAGSLEPSEGGNEVVLDHVAREMGAFLDSQGTATTRPTA
ncbi:hypothetical protein C2857_002492 [Epichloe festucae Fl1]|uniref:DUF6604 domain-containing protein n=1 Tax=Epichloe festucae (strain Fl1) TaxID=877507 RepID=A0A7U3SN39_EPIFF|nr:hypothetical protein C2857_002492 [Epichloe festucae Fl1]